MSLPIMIEITSDATRTRSGTSGRTGRDYSIEEQDAWLHKPGQAYPDRICITLEKGQVPYRPGNYNLAAESFYPDRYGGLAVRPVLVPRPAETGTASVAVSGKK